VPSTGKALAAAYRDGGATRPGRLAGPGAVGPATSASRLTTWRVAGACPSRGPRWPRPRACGDPKNFKVSYVAVDDGSQAWPVSAVIGLGGIQPGDQVRLLVTGPSVKIISQAPAAGPAFEDAGPEDGP
jgi:hypothetical protein